MKPPTPPGGFGNQGNDFTVLRQSKGRIVPGAGNDCEVKSVDDTQNANDPLNIFGEDS